MQQLVIRIPEEQKLLLEALANKQNTNISALARDALKIYLYKKTTTHSASRNFLLELARVGKNTDSTKPKNLSTQYKKLLYK